MKNSLFFLVGFLSFHISITAQNYQCLQPGIKSYFTNSIHYLRGIRIDSVRIVGTSTLFYPFHTPRGKYNGSMGGNPLDTNGGSWLGKIVTQQQDGTTIFDNWWGGTLTIKTRTPLGSQWTFYTDTSSIYYRATVIAKDTISIAGLFDSVKTILVEAMQGSVPLPGDPANGFKIMLSKDHGFVQVFDLYTFPSRPGHGDYYMEQPYFGVYDKIFRRTPFQMPDSGTVYNFSPGDMFQYTRVQGGLGGPSPAGTITDSIISKQITGNQIIYSVKERVIKPDYPWIVTNPTYTISNSTMNFIVKNIHFPIADTSLMPEEWHIHDSWFYNPSDSTFCTVSPWFATVDNFIDKHGILHFFEPCGVWTEYKGALGTVDLNVCTDPTPLSDDIKLTYFRHSGIPCGNFNALAVPVIPHTESAVSIAPNPARDQFTIHFPTSNVSRQIDLYDYKGDLLIHQETNKSSMAIDGSQLPAGMYVIRTMERQSTTVNRMILMH